MELPGQMELPFGCANGCDDGLGHALGCPSCCHCYDYDEDEDL